MAYIRIVSQALLLAAVQMLEAQTIFNPAPSRIVGQAVLQQQGVLTAIAPNLVEGREFNNPQADRPGHVGDAAHSLRRRFRQQSRAGVEKRLGLLPKAITRTW